MPDFYPNISLVHIVNIYKLLAKTTFVCIAEKEDTWGYLQVQICFDRGTCDSNVPTDQFNLIHLNQFRKMNQKNHHQSWEHR